MKTLSDRPEPPTFACEENVAGQWRFFCPRCRDWHNHSAWPGHRVAHCWDIDRRGRNLPPSYLKPGGYNLVLDPRQSRADRKAILATKRTT